MWIKEISLYNFQAHSDLTLKFTKGVNVIHGKSDVGKSCIRRAIEWLCFNNKIDGIRKTNTKLTYVKITLDNDIAIERQKSASINRYILYKNNEEIKFDSIGKTVPDEIKEALQLEPISIDNEEIYLNSAPQISLPFLFDKSPSFRIKIFNKLTGNDILDKLFVQFNKDILSINREHKSEIIRYKEQKENLEELETKKGNIENVFEDTARNMEILRKMTDRYCKLLELKDLMEKVNTSIMNIKKDLKNIKLIESIVIKELMTKNDRLQILNTMKIELEYTQNSLDNTKGQLKETNPVTLNYGELYKDIEQLDTLKNIKIKLDNNKEICYTLNEKERRLNVLICKNKKLIIKIIKEIKTCPECKQEIKQ